MIYFVPLCLCAFVFTSLRKLPKIQDRPKPRAPLASRPICAYHTLSAIARTSLTTELDDRPCQREWDSPEGTTTRNENRANLPDKSHYAIRNTASLTSHPIRRSKPLT